MSRTDPAQAVWDELEPRIANALRTLLGTKHLYQTVRIDDSSFPPVGLVAQAQRGLQESLLLNRWYPDDPVQRQVGGRIEKPKRQPPLTFRPPDVKLFCRSCDRAEPFNAVSAKDVLIHTSDDHYDASPGAIQIFVLSYQCQGCKGVPEVVLVRREGLKLIHSGRSPMEHLTVPTVVPSSIRQFYSRAVLAHQSGQTLAANFLLRTTVEQWVRSFPDSAELPADKALDWYMSTLPADFAARFPSIRGLYGELSDDIHRATGSTELFDRALSVVVEHFKAREVYRL